MFIARASPQAKTGGRTAAISIKRRIKKFPRIECFERKSRSSLGVPMHSLASRQLNMGALCTPSIDERAKTLIRRTSSPVTTALACDGPAA
jgi:hypothetical protein